ncbi:MAG: hypothetical protein KDC44_25125, partial [Phaeodactylibacter sp.]|nr:hypothetical protein [Phaeodactylibacter sp.]
DQILYRHEDFWREINGHNLTKGWVESPSYVLSLFGEADIEALTDYSHREIVRICKLYKPGTANYHLVEGSDHSMIKVGSMDDGAALRGTPEYFNYLQQRFNYSVVSIIDEWMQRVIPLHYPEQLPATQP